ncbi:MAG: hypothetical protein EBS10_04820, partial [Acidimicrobiia bacterium]|nr:hypothetical protein [Acidimicrobiia bacterium]
MSGRYVVRTYGCQMNEHDSERIAGLLEADGYAEADDLDGADVVVLNTCCIRENADNKLYGNLGHLKTWKDAVPGRRVVVAGCLAQKDRDTVRERAPHVDVVLGTHNVHRTAELLGSVESSGPVTEILEEAELAKLGMGALLGVGQGSDSPSKLAVIQWKGAEGAPLALVGKGVVFDTGGISLKPAGGMEDMTMDMG